MKNLRYNLRHDILVIMAMVLALVALSCASTPKQKQLLSIETFNGVYRDYLDAYDRQTPEIKAEWKVKIDPLFDKASKAIEAYALIADPNSLEAKDKAEIYKLAKNTALKLLLTYGVEIKEK